MSNHVKGLLFMIWQRGQLEHLHRVFKKELPNSTGERQYGNRMDTFIKPFLLT